MGTGGRGGEGGEPRPGNGGGDGDPYAKPPPHASSDGATTIVDRSRPSAEVEPVAPAETDTGEM